MKKLNNIKCIYIYTLIYLTGILPFIISPSQYTVLDASIILVNHTSSLSCNTDVDFVLPFDFTLEGSNITSSPLFIDLGNNWSNNDNGVNVSNCDMMP